MSSFVNWVEEIEVGANLIIGEVSWFVSSRQVLGTLGEVYEAPTSEKKSFDVKKKMSSFELNLVS